MKTKVCHVIIGGTIDRVIHANALISRPGEKPSGQWKLTGAVRKNNFGRNVQHYSFQQIFERPDSIQWLHKNGKQRVFCTDFDHGSHRIWISPSHIVVSAY